MTADNTDPNDNTPNGDEGDKGGGDDEQAAKDLVARRKAALDKIQVDAQRQSLSQQSQNQNSNSTDEFDIDLDDVDKDTAKSIKAALAKAKQVNDYAGQLADFGIKQARRVKAFEIAQEFNAFDDVSEFEKALEGAATPKEIELAGKEIIIKLKEDGSFAPPTTPKPGEKKKEPAANRQFDGGRGQGQNSQQALLDEINAIDPRDPEANKKLDALYKRVEAAQQAFQKRRAA